MKANQKFRRDEDAVSPVIAVILMVAITVVLAATVFVLVSNIGSNASKAAPQIGWSDDNVNQKWVVNQAPNSITWNSFQAKVGKAPVGTVKMVQNSGAKITLCAPACATQSYVALTDTGVIQGGDSLRFCSTAAESNIPFTLLHTASNSIAHQFTFVGLVADGTC